MLRRSVLALVGTVALASCQQKPAEIPKATPGPVVVAPPPPVKVEAAPAVELRAPKECAAPIETGPLVELTLGTRAAKQMGSRLRFQDADADGTLKFGVLGPVNEDSGAVILALRKYVKFFQAEKVDAIFLTGDSGEVEPKRMTHILTELGLSKLPIFTIIGNRECRGAFTEAVNAAKALGVPVVNLNEIRVIDFPELRLVTLPGYHDANFIACAPGCQYLQGNIDEVAEEAKAATVPVALVAHGPPHGAGKTSLDYADSSNVGDVNVATLLSGNNFSFGFFSNIKEAGGRPSSF
jgi:hypothetical protein